MLLWLESGADEPHREGLGAHRPAPKLIDDDFYQQLTLPPKKRFFDCPRVSASDCPCACPLDASVPAAFRAPHGLQSAQPSANALGEGTVLVHSKALPPDGGSSFTPAAGAKSPTSPPPPLPFPSRRHWSATLPRAHRCDDCWRSASESFLSRR